MRYNATEEEERLNIEIRELYNSGRCDLALQKSIAFLASYPDSHLARYNCAVMHGDYSYSPLHSPEEKERLLGIAKAEIKKLFHDPTQEYWPEKLRRNMQNEYYWFFELHEEQYNHGMNLLKTGNEGDYSACVGASMMALKQLRSDDKVFSEEWAKRLLLHFEAFQKLHPHWYNINYFAAQALACLGKYDEALACFKKMYEKQKNNEKPEEVFHFQSLIEEIKSLRDHHSST